MLKLLREATGTKALLTAAACLSPQDAHVAWSTPACFCSRWLPEIPIAAIFPAILQVPFSAHYHLCWLSPAAGAAALSSCPQGLAGRSVVSEEENAGLGGQGREQPAPPGQSPFRTLGSRPGAHRRGGTGCGILGWGAGGSAVCVCHQERRASAGIETQMDVDSGLVGSGWVQGGEGDVWDPMVVCPILVTPWTVACQAPPGKNTGAGCRFLFQGLFPAQGLNRLSCIAGDSYQLSYQGRPCESLPCAQRRTSRKPL